MRSSLLFFFDKYPKRLLPIVENGLNGHIDTTGKIIILPKFKAIQYFSEGVAAAREGGYYGYIDSTGSWAIAPLLYSWKAWRLFKKKVSRFTSIIKGKYLLSLTT